MSSGSSSTSASNAVIESRAYIHYYVRCGYSRTLINYTADQLKRRGGESWIVFWRAFGLAREGNIVAALRDCDTLKNKRDAEYAALLAMVHYHQRAKLIDHDALSIAEASLKSALERATIPSLLLAATFQWIIGDTALAHANIDRILNENSNHEQALGLKGWLYATAGTRIGLGGIGHGIHNHPSSSSSSTTGTQSNSAYNVLVNVPGPSTIDQQDAEDAIQYFEKYISLVNGPKDIDIMIGFARAYERLGRYEEATDILTDISAMYPTYLPALIDKAKLCLRTNQWDYASDLLNRVLSMDEHNIEAHRYIALLSLIQDGPGARALVHVQDLAAAVSRNEPKNATLLFHLARTLSRLAGKSRAILATTIGLIEAASRLDPDAAVYPVELGTQRLLAGDTNGAINGYKEGARIDDGNTEAVAGLIHSQVLLGQIDDAEAQLEMFRMISESLGKSAEVALLDAQVYSRKHNNRLSQLQSLEEAEELHKGIVLSALGSAATNNNNNHQHQQQTGPLTRYGLPVFAPSTIDPNYYYVLLDPELLMEMAKEYCILPDIPIHGSASSSTNSSGTASPSSSSAAPLGALLALQPYPDAVTLSSDPVRHALAILDHVTTCIPGCLSAWLLTALIRSLCQDWDGAIQAITRVLRVDESYSDAHLLLAHIGLMKNDTRMAFGALEQALANSFSIQESPSYHRLRAKALQIQGKIDEAITTLENAIRLSGVRINTVNSNSSTSNTSVTGLTTATGRRTGALPGTSSSSVSSNSSSGPLKMVPLAERSAIFLQLASCYTEAKKLTEASTLLQEAMSEFIGTSEEINVIIASAQLSLERNEIDNALGQLNTIPKESPAYSLVLNVKANIYLKYRRDRVRYIRCYTEIVARNRNETSLCQLGDAHMRMGEPEEAIDAYSTALAIKPTEAMIARKIGHALVSLHDYRRAVQFYTSALAGSEAGAVLSVADKLGLRSDLIELLIKLQRYDDAKRLIAEAAESTTSMNQSIENDDCIMLQYARKNLLLLARVQKSAGDHNLGLETMHQVIDIQTKLLNIPRGGGGGGGGSKNGGNPSSSGSGFASSPKPGGGPSTSSSGTVSTASIESEREEAAKIYVEAGSIAEHCVPPQEEKASGFYSDALRQVENYTPALLALARLHLKKGEIEIARTACSNILQNENNNEEAAIILADIEFQNNETEAAMYHFSQVLDKQPNNYTVMYRLAGLLRRSGKADEITKFLKNAVKANPTAEADAGYRLIQGVYYRFSNKPHDAIKCLNSIRTTIEYGAIATEHMVMIYLSPDNDPLWLDRDANVNNSSQSTGSNGTNSSSSALDINESLRIASRLLTDLPLPLQNSKHTVLSAYVLVMQRYTVQSSNGNKNGPGTATNPSANFDEALGLLGSVLEKDPDNVSALLALATVFMISKQLPKARNQLKRLLKLPYTSDYADEFVLGWLLLADIYSDGGKYDQAQESLQRAIALDASCGRAYEFLGGIAERELRWAEAATYYEQAWLYDHETSAPVGYKLAFNYLKASRFIDAIDVCHKVLKMYPDYPRIRTEVLAKCRALLRP